MNIRHQWGRTMYSYFYPVHDEDVSIPCNLDLVAGFQPSIYESLSGAIYFLNTQSSSNELNIRTPSRHSYIGVLIVGL